MTILLQLMACALKAEEANVETGLPRPRTTPASVVFAGLNVGLAIVSSVGLAYVGHASIAWPICMMVAAVYGLPSALRSFRVLGSPT